LFHRLKTTALTAMILAISLLATATHSIPELRQGSSARYQLKVSEIYLDSGEVLTHPVNVAEPQVPNWSWSGEPVPFPATLSWTVLEVTPDHLVLRVEFSVPRMKLARVAFTGRGVCEVKGTTVFDDVTAEVTVDRRTAEGWVMGRAVGRTFYWLDEENHVDKRYLFGHSVAARVKQDKYLSKNVGKEVWSVMAEVPANPLWEVSSTAGADKVVGFYQYDASSGVLLEGYGAFADPVLQDVGIAFIAADEVVLSSSTGLEMGGAGESPSPPLALYSLILGLVVAATVLSYAVYRKGPKPIHRSG